MVSFAVTASNLQSDKNDVMKKFLSYSVSDGQKVLPAGYVPLPPTLTARSNSAIAQLPEPAKVSPSPAPAPAAAASAQSQSQSSSAPVKVGASAPQPAATQGDSGGTPLRASAAQNTPKVVKKGGPAKKVAAIASPPKAAPGKTTLRPAAPLALVARVSEAVNPLQSSAARYLLPILLFAALAGLVAGPATAAGTAWTTPSKRRAIVEKAKAMFGR